MVDKIEIFNDNAEFFERFSNSDKTTTKDRLGRDRKTISGIEQDVEDSLSGAIAGVETAKEDAIEAVNNMGESVGTGKVVREGAYGLGVISTPGPIPRDTPWGSLENGFWKIGAGQVGQPIFGTTGSGGMRFGWGPTYFNFLYGSPIKERFAILSVENGVNKGWAELYTTKNTIVDSNGNLKTASPVLRLFNDRIETNDQFTEEPIFEKISTGKYKISNTQGLATEGWYIETPKDKNGFPYFLVDWEQDEDSLDVVISVFKKKLDLDTLDFVKGSSADIGDDERWIDLRFNENAKAEDE